MGIDVPAFRRGVDRPEDAAAERGSIITRGRSATVQTGGNVIINLFQNNSGADRFLQTANLSQRPTSSQPVQADVAYEINVVDSNNVSEFRLTGTGGTLSEILPGLPVRPNRTVFAVAINRGSTAIEITASISLRTD